MMVLKSYLKIEWNSFPKTNDQIQRKSFDINTKGFVTFALIKTFLARKNCVKSFLQFYNTTLKEALKIVFVRF